MANPTQSPYGARLRPLTPALESIFTTPAAPVRVLTPAAAPVRALTPLGSSGGLKDLLKDMDLDLDDFNPDLHNDLSVDDLDSIINDSEFVLGIFCV